MIKILYSNQTMDQAATSQYFRLDGSWADGTNVFTAWPDNSIIALGDGADLKIYHDASHIVV